MPPFCIEGPASCFPSSLKSCFFRSTWPPAVTHRLRFEKTSFRSSSLRHGLPSAVGKGRGQRPTGLWGRDAADAPGLEGPGGSVQANVHARMQTSCGSARVLLLHGHWTAPELGEQRHLWGRVETTVTGTSRGVGLSRGKGDTVPVFWLQKATLFQFQNWSAVEPWRCHRQHPRATSPAQWRHLYHLSNLSRASACCGFGAVWPCDLPRLSSLPAASPMPHVSWAHHFGHQWPLYGFKGHGRWWHLMRWMDLDIGSCLCLRAKTEKILQFWRVFEMSSCSWLAWLHSKVLDLFHRWNFK